MVEMKSKDGSTILAHPSKVESLQNMGWTISSEKAELPPVIEETDDSEEE